MNRSAIICVDDEEIILSSLEKQLKRSIGKNYDIELASSGAEALALCARLQAEGITIALVISDHLMPGMSGDEFLIKLHTLDPQTIKIMLTGQADADSVGKVVNQAELYRYIAKPWDETDLILTVKEALRRYGQERQLAQQNKLLNQTNILLKQANEKLSNSLELLLATFEAADDGILVLDHQGSVVIFNQQFTTLLQINPLSIEKDGNHILGLISRRIIEPVACDLTSKMNRLARQQYDLLKLNNGTVLESYCQMQKLQGEVVGIVWGFRDVTEKERAKALAEHKSLHDTLTQLPKRTILNCQLTEAIAKAKANSHLLAVIFVDLDRFKIISDTLGYQISDNLLKVVVQRIKDCLQGNNLIARWGRDEFTILLTEINNKNEVNAIAENILAVLKLPFNIGSKPIYIKCNIGIALYPQHGDQAENLIKKADAALTQSQQLGSNNFQYYDPSINLQVHQLFTLENQLHTALEKNEFILYYQPIVSVITGKIVKMEALLRWQNPQLGLVSPHNFIHLAEDNGSIISIGKWVLTTACTQQKTWQNMGLAPTKISVNLSARQFQETHLVTVINSILKQTELSPLSLELEITESTTMQNVELAKTILVELNELGISLSIDDFGNGYSSLSYLQKFPVQTLKIDRSLIKDLYFKSQDMAIVKAVITLGEELNLNIVAEGVETAELRDLLKNLGCEYIQGYLYSKPVPASEATQLLKQYNFD